MSREERAKQFMPFAALKGYHLALQEKERVVVPRKELSEDGLQELDYKLRHVKERDVVTVVYFRAGEYLRVTGMVSRLDVAARVLQIVNTKIYFDDIYDINGEMDEGETQ